MKFANGLQEIQIVLIKYNNMVYNYIESKQVKFSVFLHYLVMFVFGLPIFRGSLLSWGFYFQEAKNILYRVKPA